MDLTRRFHKIKVKAEVFEVDVRYTDLVFIASGAYGNVVSAQDNVSNRKVAIKKVKDVFRNLTDAKRILRELKLLRHLGGHENIIWILDVMVSPNARDFKDLYIVTDLMETDLGRIIDSSQTLSDAHIKYFMYQMLRALKYTHSAQILHRDLKPQNILVNSSCELVVCDFGLARCTGTGAGASADAAPDAEGDTGGDEDMDGAGPLTVYVVTRWYRAPELLLGCTAYGPGVDMWSVGCILAEILGRKPLFRGSNYQHQLQVIVEVLGSPAPEAMRNFQRKSAKDVVDRMGVRERVPLSRLFPRANPLAIDLLDKLLVFDPEKRISASDALSHPYLSDYHFPDDEPVAPRMLDIDFEKQAKMSKQELQMRMIREMSHFHTVSADAAPTPSARLQETAAKHDAVASVLPAPAPDAEPESKLGEPVAATTAAAAAAAGGPVADAAVEGSAEEIKMSRTALKDLEFEQARKEAQRMAQQLRGASALAALGGAAGAGAGAGAGASAKPPINHARNSSTGSVLSKSTFVSEDDDSDLEQSTLSKDLLSAIDARFSKLEEALLARVSDRIMAAVAPLDARIQLLEARLAAAAAKRA